MWNFPKTEKKIRDRISQYERSLKAEKRKFGGFDDSYGKRYLIAWLYFGLGNMDAFAKYAKWFDRNFPDDMGEPVMKLCWAVVLSRLGKQKEARYRLADLMLSNFYYIPYVLGEDTQRLDMKHFSNWSEPDYVTEIPEEVFDRITEEDKSWMKEAYASDQIQQVRDRYIAIQKELEMTENRNQRSQLITEQYSLAKSLL